MDILKKFIIIISPLLLSSCYEDFEPHIDTQPVLCLNSLITPGNPIEVKVTHTWVFTDERGEKNHNVEDATLQIYANGELVDSDYLPQEGDRIRIKAISSKYGDAEAEVTVPIATKISSLDFTAKPSDFWMSQTDGWGIDADIEFGVNIAMEIADTEITGNFYRLGYDEFDYYLIHPDNYGELTDIYLGYPYKAHFSTGNFESVDPIFYEQNSSFDEMMNSSDYNLFFSDRLLNHKSKELEFGFSPCFFRLSGWNGDPEYLECGYQITLYSISESYYKWLAYCVQSSGIVFGDFGDFGLADPIWGYSNVSTGAGVVAAQSSATITLNLQEFLYDYISKECK